MPKRAIAAFMIVMIVASTCIVYASIYESKTSTISQTIKNKPNYYINQLSTVDSSADKGTHSNFTAQKYGPDSIYDTLTEADTTGGYSGVSTVTATGSIPNDMDKDQPGSFGAVFFNPTDNVYTLTRVEFNASLAVNGVFNNVGQGAGVSYPTSGWVQTGGHKVILWTGTLNVQPRTSQEIYVDVIGAAKSETFNVIVRITANSTVYASQAYTCEQVNGNYPFSTLWLGQGPTPTYALTASPSTQKTFYVSLEEDGNKIAINSGGTLTN
jgi:hypothetical protein